MGFGGRWVESDVTVPWAPRTSWVRCPMRDRLRRINTWVYGSCSMSMRTRPYAWQTDVLSTMSDGSQTQTSNVGGVWRWRMSMRPQDHMPDWLTAPILLPGGYVLMSVRLQDSMAVLWLSHGSYLFNFAMSMCVQVSIYRLAHPTVQFNVGNRAN